MTYEDLAGREFLFYGVDAHLFKIDDQVFEVLEDPNDGLRSYLGELVERERGSGLFFREPVAIVTCRRDRSDYCDGWSFWDDEHQHEWLRFGTDNSDDCYPLFYFRYEPLKNYTPRNRPPLAYKEPHPIDRLFDEREI